MEEMMDNKKIRRIIAREGITVLGAAILAFLFIMCAYAGILGIVIQGTGNTQGWDALFLLLFSLIYLPVRFIIWAVKTLREK